MKKIKLIIAMLIINITVFAQFNKGTKVLIDYQGQWYSGKILEVKNDKYLVTYDNYDASWNEYVGKDRLKMNEAASNEQGKSLENKTENKSAEIAKQKADEMCNCFKIAIKTKNDTDKKKCLSLQEQHVTILVKGSENYYAYKKLMSDCEKELAAINSSGTSVPKTYEEKVKAVCNCFDEVKQGKNQKFNCFKMQSDLGATLGDRKVEFNLETNKCDK